MRIMVLAEKHCRRYFDVSSLGNLCAAALQVVRERSAEGCYDDPMARSERNLLMKALRGDASAAWLFLQHRSDQGFVYEKLKTVVPEVVS